MTLRQNATSGIGIDKNKVDRSAYNALVDETPIAEILMSNLENKISVLPFKFSFSRSRSGIGFLIQPGISPKKALENIALEFDFILIDCPPSLGLLTINALAAANSILIPVQCEYYALEGLTQLLNTITLVRKNLNSALEIEGVVLTMADYRTNLTQEVISEVRNYFKEKDLSGSYSSKYPS